MKYRQGCLHLALVMILLWLVGCAAPLRTPPPDGVKSLETAPNPQNLATAIRTLVTAAARPPLTTPAYKSPATEAAPKASPTETPNPYPEPGALPAGATNTPKEVRAASATGAPAVPFQDCARTPGLFGCAPDAPPLKARLAFFDFSPQRLVSLDLETGQGWQVAQTGDVPVQLDLSKGGSAQDARLLVSMTNGQYTLYTPDGIWLETFASDTVPLLQPDGALSRDGWVHASEGIFTRKARLEHTKDLRWLLHVRNNEVESSFQLGSNPGDILYRLLGWSPGNPTLLAQAYFAGNQAMTMGGRVIAIDVGTGSIREFPAAVPLRDDAQAYFAWDPIQTGRVALLETSETDVTAPRLALLDLQANKVDFPLPEGLLVNSLAWHPDGRLAFSVASVEGLVDSEARKRFPGAGIYWFDPETGKTQPLVSTPPGAVDGWLHFLADGSALVYARLLPSTGAKPLIEVRAHRLSDGKEWVLVQKSAGPESSDTTDFERRLLAFGLK